MTVRVVLNCFLCSFTENIKAFFLTEEGFDMKSVARN